MWLMCFKKMCLSIPKGVLWTRIPLVFSFILLFNFYRKTLCFYVSQWPPSSGGHKKDAPLAFKKKDMSDIKKALAKLGLDQTESPKRIAIKVKPVAERSIRQGHPWVFEGSIVKQSGEGKAGDLAIVFDQKKNKFLALGLLDPGSPIRVKILQKGKPATIDGEWFRQKTATAFAKRKALLETDTDGYRLLHGENDGLPGLVADVYAEVLVVKIYSAIWRPYLSVLLPQIFATAKAKTLVIRLSRNLQNDAGFGLSDGQIICGELPGGEVVFREHGLKFSANVVRGHKTGFFLDHRHNRKRVGELASLSADRQASKKVLDVFAYAGGFSVHALAGGAAEVWSLDISAHALEMAKRNVALNFSGKKHRTLAEDAFEGMKKLSARGQKFGLVIVDPPSFAKREKEVEAALKSYGRLAKLAAKLVSPGGILFMASCSSRVSADVFFEKTESGLAASGRKRVLLEKTFHDLDHPIGFPEGAYLKAGYWRME